MNTLSPLEFSFPDLSLCFKTTDVDTRRKAIMAICSLATTQTGLGDEYINMVLKSGYENHFSQEVKDKLRSLSEKYDEEYFKLTDDTQLASSDRAKLAFSNARILSALSFSLDKDFESLETGIYEALMSVQDKPKAKETAYNILSSK